MCVTDDGGGRLARPRHRPAQAPLHLSLPRPEDHKAPLTFYATFYEGGVYRSTDSGQTWVKRSEGLGNPGNLHAYMVKVHPKTGDVSARSPPIASVARDFPVPGGLWKSTDGGENWADITKSLGLKWPGGFALHPDDPNTIYLTAGTVPGGARAASTRRPTAGQAWTRVIGDADFAERRRATSTASSSTSTRQARLGLRRHRRPRPRG